jgi:pimeloyl-ACP methyl ester carboxylesterase
MAGRGEEASLESSCNPLSKKDIGRCCLTVPHTAIPPKKQTNIREFSDVILKIGQRVGPLKAIVGHSFGGNSSVVALHRGLQSEKIVILASPSDVESVFKSFSDFLNLSPKTRSAFQTLVEENVRWPASEISPVKLAAARTEPLLIIHDRKDPEVDFAHAQKIAKAWNPSNLIEVEGEGHYRILKSSKVINSVIEFLQNN